MTRVLGIESTAWAASAAWYDTETDDLLIESDPYVPPSGGIHPREAAEHMRDALPRVIDTVVEQAEGVDVVAFSRGPGLGPCLRIGATAARALAGAWDLPLVGVNHMVAHLEIGRHQSGFEAPVCLNASGANAHVLGYADGRYRVLGETMDTGIGNAIDKFARHVGWSHPGGPKVEQAAVGGEYVHLPYIVKGMDFSFSGLTSAAQARFDDHVTQPVSEPADAEGTLADLCFSLQETMFAMLTEVSERALSLTGRSALVLGGGVGQNDRLQTMLSDMCAARDAVFFAPEDRLLRDNAGMIAVLGAKMFEAGDTLPISDSPVDPGFRPDELEVTWRTSEPLVDGAANTEDTHGAEAFVTISNGVVEKRRTPKAYRHPTLDLRLRRERTVAEARLLHDARRQGVATPVITDIDRREASIQLERVGRADLLHEVTESRVREVGRQLAILHESGMVHGDPTVRNVRISGASESDETGRVYLIDFGLGFYSDDVEDFAMDLHIFEQSLGGTTTAAARFSDPFETAYDAVGDSTVLDRLREIEGRGRYQAD